jgi:hypothetical protein
MISKTSREYLVTGLKMKLNRKRSTKGVESERREGGREGEGHTLHGCQDGIESDPCDDPKGTEDVVFNQADWHEKLVPDLNREGIKI